MQQIYEFTSNWQAISRTIMLFCACLLFSLFSSAQNSNVRITIKNKNISVIEALKEVEKQARLSVGYNESQLKTKPSIALSLEKATLESALTVILKETGYTYQLQGQHILIVPQEKRQGTGTPKRVTGCVTDEEGEPLIGVNVHVEGTGAGTITDIDGNFVLEVATGNTLRFTYVGYTSQTVKVGGQNSYNVQLASDTKQLNEVVVTALGIKRATKALSYNVQEVKAADITSNKDANFVNALSGKVAGVNINSSSSGVGGISKVVMRGTKSIMQSSNALYVIDGVPMFSSGNSGGSTEFGSQGTTEPIADINPEDIESMSVLTGAAAAALYGSDAANGAIVITTKKGKEGRVSISFNSNTEFTNPLVLPMFQTRYGTGSAVNGKDAIDRSWGEHLTVANYQGYNPRSDYFQTGVISTESVSFSTGTDKNQTYASASALNSKGIVPNNKYTRYNFTARNTTKFLNDKMTFDFGTNYIRQEDRNMVNQGTYNNPIVGAYIFPRGNDWEEIKAYERYNVARKIYIQYWPMGDAGMTVQNPYWVNYRNLRENKKDRYMMNANLAYQVLEWLTVSGRVRIDHSSNDYTERFFATTNNQLTMGSNNGSYDIIKSTDKQLYADFLLNANKNLGEDWSLQASFGGSFSDMRSNSLQVIGPIADGSIEGERTGLPNFFAVQNLRVSQTQHMQAGWREQTQSLFASAELGYKSTYYLTLTGRNDWPSQLAGPKSTNSSFFYPSAGLSVVLSELMPKVNKDYLSYLKLRASYASVGVAFKRYLANPQNSWNSAGGTWSLQTNYPIYDLKPERTKSFEVGLSMKFLKDFNLDVTYYNNVSSMNYNYL